MVPGDISIFTTSIGQKLVAIVLHQNEDGTYAIFCPKPTFNEVKAEGHQVPGTLFDPTIPPEEGGIGEAQFVPGPGIASMLQGSSSPAGLWPPRNLNPVPMDANAGAIFKGDVVRPTSDGKLEYADEPATPDSPVQGPETGSPGER